MGKILFCTFCAERVFQILLKINAWNFNITPEIVLAWILKVKLNNYFEKYFVFKVITKRVSKFYVKIISWNFSNFLRKIATASRLGMKSSTGIFGQNATQTISDIFFRFMRNRCIDFFFFFYFCMNLHKIGRSSKAENWLKLF